MTEIEKTTLAATFKLFEGLAVLQPSNFGHMKRFLDAEEARSRASYIESVDLYDQAIAEATEAKFIHLAAWYNERCAALLSKPKLTAGYLFEAMKLWQTWGCTSKVASLAAEHPLLFASLLPKPAPPMLTLDLDLPAPTTSIEISAMSESGEKWTRPDLNRRKSSAGSRGSAGGAAGADSPLRSNASIVESPHHRSQLATELDLRTVVQASAVISSEHNVDGAVAKLLALTMRTAGATYALLVLCKGGTLCAEAIATSDSNEVRKLGVKDAIDDRPDMCKSIRSLIL